MPQITVPLVEAAGNFSHAAGLHAGIIFLERRNSSVYLVELHCSLHLKLELFYIS